MTSLHEIAPRLAVAQDVERWNIWCAGDEPYIKDGERWAETVSATHAEERCRFGGGCGGTVDHYEIAQRILVGMNKGQVGLIESWRCRQCGNSQSKHR